MHIVIIPRQETKKMFTNTMNSGCANQMADNNLIYCLYFHFFVARSCLLLRYASQNSLDESSQNKIPRSSKDKTAGTYQNDEHTLKCFKSMNEMRK